MNKVSTLFLRDFESYFFSPIAYVVLTVFLVFSGYMFGSYMEHPYKIASLRPILGVIALVLLFLSPIITMRLFAEEIKGGTLETLMTDPVTDFQVVFAKFLAGFAFYVFLLIPTLVYVVILRLSSEPDMGPIWASYIGLLLLGGVFISIGLFTSSLTSNQIVAAVLSLVALLFLWILGSWGAAPQTALGKVAKYINVIDHFETFRKGLIDTRDVFFYLSTTGLFLFLTTRTVESRKWR